jgi:hypothetical protein
VSGISANAVARLAWATSALASIAAGVTVYIATSAAIAGSGSGVPPTMNPGAVVPPSAIAGKNPAKPAASLPAKPLWAELTPAQQQALAPMASEWDKLDASHKKKWLAISSKFASLKPDQQLRLQNRMRDWAKLTPEQRRVARESYTRAKKLNPGEKTAEWQQYQQLSEEQKKKLAADAATKKRVANLPPASQTKGKVTPPPKLARKPRPEQPSAAFPSAILPAASQFPAQPSPPPAIK